MRLTRLPKVAMMLNLSRRAQVAAALSRNVAGVSGEMLAGQLGISRVAVSNHVAALRLLGYQIDSAPRVGYRLIASPDSCIPEEVGPLLGDRLWVCCEGGAEVGSTNDEAKQLARAGAPEGTLVVAGRQTVGRGRFDRTWVSPAGGAYASVVLRPPVVPSAVAPLSLVVALGAARALRASGLDARVKWPNDLECEGRKLGGVLLEMAAEADRVEWLVVGIGINVAEPGQERAAWVRERLPDSGIAEIAASVLDSVARAYREWLGAWFAPLSAEYESLLTLTGLTVTVRDAARTVLAEGRVLGVDDSGALRLQTGSGDVAITSGEVTLQG